VLGIKREKSPLQQIKQRIIPKEGGKSSLKTKKK
jgi:hypothetical protein